MPQVLLVEDDASSREALAGLVRGEGFGVRAVENLEKARATLAEEPFALVLTDLQLPDGSALDLLPDLERHQSGTDVVFVTGYASIDSAIEALRGGVVDYLKKPVEVPRLRRLLANVRRTSELRQEIATLRTELREAGRFGPLIGASPQMQQVYEQIQRVSPTDANVFITGETGTGKEIVAETIHSLSPRSRAPFVPVNCGAISRELIESELFGHEKGSFTGATRRHTGFFERANGGTLFLDEITEMPRELQVKLLRALESRKVLPVGGDEPTPVDVRVLAAANRDPREAVREGKMREDLLYRLFVVPIDLPPLRDRADDVELLARHFLEELNRGAEVRKRFTPAAMRRIRAHGWPGNVRELRNVVERAFIMAADEITPESFPFASEEAPLVNGEEIRFQVGTSIKDAERAMIFSTLEHLGGDKRQTAKILGISLKTLYNRLNSYK